MNHEHYSLKYGVVSIDYAVIRRNRKTLEIAVEPNASVTVTAPFETTVADIEKKVRKRAAWILRQQRFFHQFLPRTPERLYQSGETHLYLGRQYRLKVVPGKEARVILTRGFLTVYSRNPDRPETTRGLLDSWYRQRAGVKFSERLEINLQRFPKPEAYRPNGMIIRAIGQRWGSMSRATRLLLNLRLIQAPTDAIDYVITHELCHIEEPHHGPAFFNLLNIVMPDWLRRKERLERLMA